MLIYIVGGNTKLHTIYKWSAMKTYIRVTLYRLSGLYLETYMDMQKHL